MPRITKYNKKSIIRFVLVIILVLGIVGAFVYFHNENDRIVLKQSKEYTAEVCYQMASQISSLLESRKKDLNILSYVVSDTDAARLTEADYLYYLQDISPFDYIEFIDLNGINHNAGGLISDATDRTNYIDGINGGSGISVIFNSRITNETLIVFYAPVINNGQIVGVLNGMIREESLKKTMQVTISEEAAANFLCMSDGTIICSTNFDRPITNYLDGLVSGNITDDETTALVRKAFAEKKSITFYGNSRAGRGTVAVVPVLNNWMFVQTFPGAVNERMIRESNGAGLKFEMLLILIFSVYAVYLLVKWVESSRKLKDEKVLNSELREKNKDAELVNAVLAEEYTNVYLLNIPENTIEVIKQEGYVIEQVNSGERLNVPYDEAWNRYITRFVHPDDCDALLENTAMEKVKEALSKNQSYKYNFRSINGGLHYFQLNYTVIEEGLVVAGFRNVDEIVWQEQAKKELNKANDILNALTEDVTHVYIINTEKGTLEIVKQEGVNAAQAEDGDVISSIEYDSLWKQYCEKNVDQDDFERVYNTGILKNVCEALKYNEEVTCNYTSCGTGNGIPYQLKYIMFSKNAIMVSAHNISNIVEREKQFALLQEAYEKLDGEKKLLTELSDVFYSIHYINIASDSHRLLKMERENVAEFLNKAEGKRNQEITWLAMKYVVNSEFVEEAIRFTDFSTLSDRMRNKKSITFEAIDDKNEWVRFMFVRIGQDLTEELTEVFLISQLIDEEVREKEKLQKASYVDGLTGTLNRNAFSEAIVKLNENSIPENLKLMVLDINGLKMTNDNYGHIAGDELISGTAECVRMAIGNKGSVYRTGGDEFTIISEMDENSFYDVLNTLNTLAESWRGEKAGKMYFSKGYVFATEIPNCRFSDLMNEADLRMYRDKQEFYKIHKEYDVRNIAIMDKKRE